MSYYKRKQKNMFRLPLLALTSLVILSGCPSPTEGYAQWTTCWDVNNQIILDREGRPYYYSYGYMTIGSGADKLVIGGTYLCKTRYITAEVAKQKAAR